LRTTPGGIWAADRTEFRTALTRANQKRRKVSKRKYSCDKCAGTRCETGEIRTTGSGFSRHLNFQHKKFATVSCTTCGYTEIYKMGSGGKISDIFDILGG